jgi:hypothetical protein
MTASRRSKFRRALLRAALIAATQLALPASSYAREAASGGPVEQPEGQVLGSFCSCSHAPVQRGCWQGSWSAFWCLEGGTARVVGVVYEGDHDELAHIQTITAGFCSWVPVQDLGVRSFPKNYVVPICEAGAMPAWENNGIQITKYDGWQTICQWNKP